MISILVGLCLAASPPRVAAMDFGRVGSVEPELATFLSEHFVQQFQQSTSLEVITSKSVAATLGLERQRQLLGCADNMSSCLTELAGALGAELMIVGEVARLDRGLQVNVRVIDASRANSLYSGSARADTTDGLLDQLKAMASDSEAPVLARFSLRRQRSASWAPWSVMGAGAAVAITGGVLLGLSASERAQLQVPRLDVSPNQIVEFENGAGTRATVGFVALGVGVAAIAGGLAWQLLRKPPPLEVALGANGAFFSVKGALP
jgi:TolB-like protein